MLSRLVEARVPSIVAALALVTAGTAGAQAEFNLGPFLTYNSMHGGHPAASGLQTGVSVGPVGLRASGFTALDQPTSTTSNLPRWGGDADLLFIFDLSSRGGGRPGLAPYVFAGAGLAVQNDTSPYYSTRMSSQTSLFGGWSYGAGLLLPIGNFLEAMGEVRQRPAGFFNVSPSSRSARNEFRIGLSIRLGSSLSAHEEAPPPPRPRPRRVDRGISVGDIAQVILPMSSEAGVAPIVIASGGPSTAARVVPTAEHYIGVPYRYGGTSPRTGFDCSGFVQYVFAKHDVMLPRTSRQQARVGTALPVNVDALAPGDLVMFAEDGGRISHVAIYVGNDRIIHSSSSGGGVRLDDLGTRRGQWFVHHMVVARRVTPEAHGLMLDLARSLDGMARDDSMLDLPDHAPKP